MHSPFKEQRYNFEQVRYPARVSESPSREERRENHESFGRRRESGIEVRYGRMQSRGFREKLRPKRKTQQGRRDVSRDERTEPK